MKKYFANCSTLDELKAEYKRLAKINHPDAGGDDATMAAINAEYDEMVKRLAHTSRRSSSASGSDSSTVDVDAAAAAQAEAEAFKAAVMAIIHLPGLVVELCGCWLWVRGETYQHRDALKRAGFRWSKDKQAWYRRPEDAAAYHRGHKSSMQQIRNKYGSTILAANGADNERRAYCIAD